YNAGVYGYTSGQTAANVPTYGVIGQSVYGFGAWGLCSAPPGTLGQPGGGGIQAVCGMLGTSTSNVGIYAISTGSYALVADGNGPSTVGALIRGQGGAAAAVFQGNVQIQGNLTVTGSFPKSGAVPHPDGTHRRLYAQESPEPWFEDF